MSCAFVLAAPDQSSSSEGRSGGPARENARHRRSGMPCNWREARGAARARRFHHPFDHAIRRSPRRLDRQGQAAFAQGERVLFSQRRGEIRGASTRGGVGGHGAFLTVGARPSGVDGGKASRIAWRVCPRRIKRDLMAGPSRAARRNAAVAASIDEVKRRFGIFTTPLDACLPRRRLTVYSYSLSATGACR